MMRAILLFLFVSVRGLAQQQSISPLLESYLNESNRAEKEKLAKQITAAKPDFKTVYDAVKNGRVYSKKRTGFFKVGQRDKKFPPYAIVFVPYDYKPEKKYPVNVFLHGAVSNMDPDFLLKRSLDTLNAAYKTSQTITIYPTAWFMSPWWNPIQFDNIRFLLSYVKQNYNVDENRVRLSGISDGATGSFYQLNCDLTPWASATPFIGSMRVLNQLNDRTTFLSNYSRLPFFVVNTGKDEIFPLANQLPYLAALKQNNSNTSVITVDSSRHSMGWFPLLRDSVNRFVERNPRNPFPSELSWATDSDERFNRCYFIVINKLGSKRPSQIPEEDNNVMINGSKTVAFKRDSTFGKLKAKVEGNTVKVSADNVRKYSILVSSEQFDLNQPIVVWTNDKKSFEGIVKPDVKTLLKWNITDDDRTMLFAAEFEITVK